MSNKTFGVFLIIAGVALLALAGWLNASSSEAAPEPLAIPSFEICINGKLHLVIPSVNYLGEIEGVQETCE